MRKLTDHEMESLMYAMECLQCRIAALSKEMLPGNVLAFKPPCERPTHSNAATLEWISELSKAANVLARLIAACA